MAHYLSDLDASELMTVLSSNYVIDACGGAVRFITETLPGKAVCAIREQGGVLYIVVDLEKPLAHRHARQMIREWRASFAGSVVMDNEPIVLEPLTPEPVGPSVLNLVS